MEKRLFLLVATLLATLTMNAQVNNFSVTESGKLIWQKVYDTNASYDDIYNLVQNNGSFADIKGGDGMITFSIKPTPVDFESMGYNRGTIAIYVSSYDFSGFATIQVKDGRYRVTVEKIRMIRTITTSVGRAGDETPLETWAVRGTSLASAFSKTPSTIYNQFLTDLFTMRAKSYLDNEW